MVRPERALWYKKLARRIERNLRRNFQDLNKQQRAHHALRILRQNPSCDRKEFFDEIHRNICDTYQGLSDMREKLDDIRGAGLEMLESIKRKSGARSRLRYRTTKKLAPKFPFFLRMVKRMFYLKDAGIKHHCDKQFRKLLEQNEHELKRIVTNAEMIRAWAAQLANFVIWLHQIGGPNIVRKFECAFRDQYPESEDDTLSKFQYQNKIYGMTHLIIADSKYYQRGVSEATFSWILPYFRENFTKIVKRTKPDVIAEVGICFLLCNDFGIEVARARSIIAVQVDKNMIPDINGKRNLGSGEHRNTLAIQLLDWKGVNRSPTVKTHPFLQKIKNTKFQTEAVKSSKAKKSKLKDKLKKKSRKKEKALVKTGASKLFNEEN